jgi:hypothetical protein
MAKRITTRCLVFALSLVAFPAYAQAEAGDGIKSGAFTLAPSLSVGSSYDTNLFFQSADEATLTAAPALNVTPAFRITTEETNNLQLSLDSSVTWQQFFGENVVRAQSGLSADVGGSVAFNTQGAFSLRIEDRLVRTNETPPNAADFTFNRLTNRLGVTAGLHPGGRALQHYLSYDFFIFRHDPLDDLNRMQHNVSLQNYWLFLPKTSFVLSGDYSFIDYESEFRDGGGNVSNPTFRNVNSQPLRVTGGLTGLITDRIGMRLVGGWGWSFHELVGDAEDVRFSGLLVDVQAQYHFGNLSNRNRIFLGYSRDFREAAISRFFVLNRPYAGYQQGFFNSRLQLNIDFDVAFRSFQGTPVGAISGQAGTVNIAGDIGDTLVTGSANLTYNLTKWWSLGAR